MPQEYPLAPEHKTSLCAPLGDIELSIVIVNYRCAPDITAAVDAIKRGSEDIRFEIIVVDNNSGDDSKYILAVAHPDVVFVEAGFNGGYAWGNNVGLSLSRGRHVLVLNPDVQVKPGALGKAVEYLDMHPEVGVLGPRIEDECGNLQSTIFRFPRLSHVLWNMFVPQRVCLISKHFGDQRYASRPRDKELDVDVTLGAFMMVPRETIEVVGGLNTRFFMYGEETEWCWRIRRADRRVVYNPAIEIVHRGAASTGGVAPWILVELSRGTIMFLRMSRGPLTAWLATLFLLIGSLPRSVWTPSWKGHSGQNLTAAWRARRNFLWKSLIVIPVGQSTPDPAAVAVTHLSTNRTAQHQAS